MNDTPRGGVLRRLDDVERAIERIDQECDKASRDIASLKEQVAGERGLSAAVTALAKEVASLRKAAYWVAGIIVASSIGFAFGVLALVPA
jgi:cell division septum initiation protein DivIVA